MDVFGDVAQLEERLLCKQDVRGSSPLISTIKFRQSKFLAVITIF